MTRATMLGRPVAVGGAPLRRGAGRPRFARGMPPVGVLGILLLAACSTEPTYVPRYAAPAYAPPYVAPVPAYVSPENNVAPDPVYTPPPAPAPAPAPAPQAPSSWSFAPPAEAAPAPARIPSPAAPAPPAVAASPPEPGPAQAEDAGACVGWWRICHFF